MFSAGADLKSWIGRKIAHVELWQTQKGMLLMATQEVFKPVIAAVSGHCLAGGMTLMLATDLQVTADRHLRTERGQARHHPHNGGTAAARAYPHAVPWNCC